MLQQFEFTNVGMGKNAKRHFSRNFDIFSTKNDLPQCLVFFFYFPLAFQRDPTVDTFEARADCRANELTLTRGRESTVQDRPCTLLHGPIGRFSYRPSTAHCYDKPIKNLLMGPWSKVYGQPSPPKIQTFQII